MKLRNRAVELIVFGAKSIRKRDLVPALLRLIEADLDRGDDARPVVQLMIKIIRYACRNLPVDDPRREGLRTFGH